MANTPIGAWVRSKRLALDLSLSAFAADIGLAKSTVSRFETGDAGTVGADTLISMADVLGLDRWEIFHRAGRADPEMESMVRAPSRGLWRLLGLLRDGGYTDRDYEEMVRWLTERRASAGMVTEERGQAGWSRRAAPKGGPGPRKVGTR